jgi:hypothetical protein
MNETEYINRIDLYFPYDDEKAWKAAIDQGTSISDNAAYMALQMICSGAGNIAQADLQRMLEYWSSHYDHPTKPTVLKAVKALLNDTCLVEEEALRYLDEIAAYPGLYNAIGIIWQAAPRGEDWGGRATEGVETRYDDIRKKWEATGGPAPME